MGIASLIIAFVGLYLARAGGYSFLWPAFSGANQLLASVVMLTVAMWVNKKLDPKYTMAVLVPAVFLWVTVTTALVWYEFAVIPTFFKDMAKTNSVITGATVGGITAFMLILNFIILFGFLKNWKTKKAVA